MILAQILPDYLEDESVLSYVLQDYLDDEPAPSPCLSSNFLDDGSTLAYPEVLPSYFDEGSKDIGDLPSDDTRHPCDHDSGKGFDVSNPSELFVLPTSSSVPCHPVPIHDASHSLSPSARFVREALPSPYVSLDSPEDSLTLSYLEVLHGYFDEDSEDVNDLPGDNSGHPYDPDPGGELDVSNPSGTFALSVYWSPSCHPAFLSTSFVRHISPSPSPSSSSVHDISPSPPPSIASVRDVLPSPPSSPPVIPQSVIAMMSPSLPLPLHSIVPSHDPILSPTSSCLYNLVVNQAHPVTTTLAKELRITRYNHRDPLAGSSPLPTWPLDTVSKELRTRERCDQLALGTGLLSPEVFELVQEEWRPGDRESSSSSHHSHQLCVLKKGSISLHLGYYLEPSRVSFMRISATSPYPDAVPEYGTSSSAHMAFNLCINLVILLGVLRLLVLTQDETSSTTVLQGGFTYATCHEIPLYALALMDDIPIEPPEVRYNPADRSREAIPNRCSVRHFVRELFGLVCDAVRGVAIYCITLIAPCVSLPAKCPDQLANSPPFVRDFFHKVRERLAG